LALYGILGGIDGNLEALSSVLAAFDLRGVQRLLCVGNVVGYNADPDECAELLRARRAIAIAGAHDRIGTGMLGFGRCSNDLGHGLARTRRQIRADTIAWLRALPTARALDDGIALGSTRTPLSFVLGSGEATAAGLCRLDRNRVYSISPGSVDAQRKSHRFAECAVFDSDAWTVEFLRLRYDAAATEAKAAVAGYRSLPMHDVLYTLQRAVIGAPQLASRIARAARGALPVPRRPGTIIGTSAR